MGHAHHATEFDTALVGIVLSPSDMLFVFVVHRSRTITTSNDSHCRRDPDRLHQSAFYCARLVTEK
jgi:hypothetical protein